MADTFRLKIVTPERTVFDEDVVSIIAPGVDGYFGVLAHHAPMLAEIGVGRFCLERASGQQEVMALAGGFLEVRADSTTLLADAAEPQQDIDLARAQSAAQRARERLANATADVDATRAEAALARALNRINVVTHH